MSNTKTRTVSKTVTAVIALVAGVGLMAGVAVSIDRVNKNKVVTCKQAGDVYGLECQAKKTISKTDAPDPSKAALALSIFTQANDGSIVLDKAVEGSYSYETNSGDQMEFAIDQTIYRTDPEEDYYIPNVNIEDYKDEHDNLKKGYLDMLNKLNSDTAFANTYIGLNNLKLPCSDPDGYDLATQSTGSGYSVVNGSHREREETCVNITTAGYIKGDCSGDDCYIAENFCADTFYLATKLVQCDSCVSGACTDNTAAAAATCTDSDSGKVEELKGTTSDGNTVHEDYCELSGNVVAQCDTNDPNCVLKEGYCDNLNSVAVDDMDCPQDIPECFQGACQEIGAFDLDVGVTPPGDPNTNAGVDTNTNPGNNPSVDLDY